jgi:hypothetical protein
MTRQVVRAVAMAALQHISFLNWPSLRSKIRGLLRHDQSSVSMKRCIAAACVGAAMTGIAMVHVPPGWKLQ